MLSFGDDGNWSSRCWKELPAAMSGGTCTAALPKSPLVYYIGGTVIDADEFRSSHAACADRPGAARPARPAGAAGL